MKEQRTNNMNENYNIAIAMFSSIKLQYARCILTQRTIFLKDMNEPLLFRVLQVQWIHLQQAKIVWNTLHYEVWTWTGLGYSPLFLFKRTPSWLRIVWRVVSCLSVQLISAGRGLCWPESEWVTVWCNLQTPASPRQPPVWPLAWPPLTIGDRPQIPTLKLGEMK